MPPDRAPSRFREVVGTDIDPSAALTRVIATHATQELALGTGWNYQGIPWESYGTVGRVMEICCNGYELIRSCQ